ncbi:hypothetical protein [Petropleomorpha daqingensis]|uniref:Uncharacterized protein n=1 Tax=Petropleomorpha daqingensis TaxID=2026353 RepID=A0A853CQK8_9ACTN|nr:hypothetical protein [Petropleomorpha daqingensis]NYJ08478.1 hypothetical protein [Petropleomorpha daqingensis]
MQATLNSLTEAELLIARSTEPEALAELDEDALLELHDRVRRARKKYLGQYRRRAAAAVEDVGGRGKAYAQNQRARDKAEVFEDALARVSTAVAKAARRSAAALKTERLAAARTAVPAPRSAPELAAVDTSADPRPPRKSSGRVKRDASDIAVGRRNQARRDSR